MENMEAPVVEMPTTQENPNGLEAPDAPAAHPEQVKPNVDVEELLEKIKAALQKAAQTEKQTAA